MYLKDIGQAQSVNEGYQDFFRDTSSSPSRSVVEVALLPKDSKIDIEAIAVLPD
jgi:enamine deaminase RidA (YjgF/YER057c/UK114 family)